MDRAGLADPLRRQGHHGRTTPPDDCATVLLRDFDPRAGGRRIRHRSGLLLELGFLHRVRVDDSVDLHDSHALLSHFRAGPGARRFPPVRPCDPVEDPVP